MTSSFSLNHSQIVIFVLCYTPVLVICTHTQIDIHLMHVDIHLVKHVCDYVSVCVHIYAYR